MHVVIRLQNHGCKNHPLWWIVVAPRKKNIKGRFIEHVGYWTPQERKIVQRSVILNKPRIKYWLAMGAQVSPKIQRFLSWIDLLPSPLVKYGSKTIYEKPQKPISVDTYKTFNQPHQNAIEKMYFDRITETQVENDLKRKILFYQQKVEEIPKTSQELQTEWDKLRAQLYQVEKDNKVINPAQRELVFKRINEIAEQWYNQKQVEGLKQIYEEKQNIKVDSKNLKEQILIQNLAIKTEKQLQDKMKWLQDLAPMEEGDVYEYLKHSQRYGQRKAKDQIKEIMDYAYKTSQVVCKALVDDFLKFQLNRTKTQNNMQSGNIKYDQISKIHYIPVSRPVHPLPDFNAYDPEEYTDIRKESEQLIKNKGYDIPNTYLEPDAGDHFFDTCEFNITKKNLGGRKVPITRNFYVSRKTRHVKRRFEKRKKLPKTTE